MDTENAGIEDAGEPFVLPCDSLPFTEEVCDTCGFYGDCAAPEKTGDEDDG